jgi:transposase
MRSGCASNGFVRARRETKDGTATTIVCSLMRCSGSRAGAPWRDLPPEFGGWNSVFRRFRRWAKTGVWERIFNALMEDPDFEYLIIDSTIVRAHQHAAGAKKGGARMRRSGVHAAA